MRGRLGRNYVGLNRALTRSRGLFCHSGHAVAHIRTYITYVRAIRMWKAAGRIPPPFGAASELKLTSARESKRKEGDVTSRLRRIKRANCMNRRARRTKEEEVARRPTFYRREVARGCPRLPKIELIRRHRARRRMSTSTDNIYTPACALLVSFHTAVLFLFFPLSLSNEDFFRYAVWIFRDDELNESLFQ